MAHLLKSKALRGLKIGGQLTHRCELNAPDFQSQALFQVLKEDGTAHEQASMPQIDSEKAQRILDCCVFTQVLDERMLASQRQGRISFYLTCTGEEAAVIGAAAALEDQDMILGQYREHAALRYRGFSTSQFMHQMFSNKNDLGHGRQMPVHYGSKQLNYQTISSPLGTQISQAAGVAYAQKLRQEEACTLCYFGEGAASEGDFHAGMNMAAVLKTPTIFFCRNNAYAISTPASEQYAGEGIVSHGHGYGMPSIQVDGNDMLAVLAATQSARAYSVASSSPVLIEALTYRMGAHSSSDDPSGYRTQEEEAQWLQGEPVKRFATWMQAQGWITQAEIDQMRQDYKQEILYTLKEAEQVAKPALSTLIEDVFAEPTPLLKAQFKDLQAHVKRHPDFYPNAKEPS
jgi:2-oxoisovalerate dehydrogenase E1 component alpha subunit